MEDGKHMGSGFCAARKMIIPAPGQASAWLTSPDTTGHMLDIQTQVFRLTSDCSVPGQPGFGDVKYELDLGSSFANGGEIVEEEQDALKRTKKGVVYLLGIFYSLRTL